MNLTINIEIIILITIDMQLLQIYRIHLVTFYFFIYIRIIGKERKYDEWMNFKLFRVGIKLKMRDWNIMKEK